MIRWSLTLMACAVVAALASGWQDVNRTAPGATIPATVIMAAPPGGTPITAIAAVTTIGLSCALRGIADAKVDNPNNARVREVRGRRHRLRHRNRWLSKDRASCRCTCGPQIWAFLAGPHGG